jgi:hypothetical protein
MTQPTTLLDEETDAEVAHAAELVERKMDWSATHEDLHSMLDLYTNE